MKISIKLTRNGNATYAVIPRRVLDFMRWRAGDPMILEVTAGNAVTVRPPTVMDLRTAGTIGVIDGSLPEAGK